MRYLLLILLTISVGFTTACSSKKSSTATPPATSNQDNDNDGNVDQDDDDNCQSGCNVSTIPGLPKPQNGEWYVGKVKNIQQTTYKKFLKAGMGVYADGGSFGDGGNYSWNYQCDFNIFALIFQGQGFNCQTQQQQYEQYIAQMAALPAIMTLSFYKNGHVEGNWLVDAYQDFYGYIDYYMGIPFQGSIVKLQDGRYLIEAGPLTLVTASANTKNTFNAFFFDGQNELPLGTVTIK